MSAAHDPFAVDQARWLEALQLEWPDFFISVNDARWYANRKDQTGDAVIAVSAARLHQALRSTWHGSTP